MDPTSFGDQPTASPETTTETIEENYSLLPGFLKNVPEQDRPIVEKYTKDWDGGVTKRFQEIHSDYKTKLEPWEKLGHTPEQVEAAIQTINTFNQNPIATYMALRDLLAKDYPEEWAQINEELQMSNDYQQQQPDPNGVPDYGDDIPPALQQQIEALQQRLDQQDQLLSQRDQAAQEQQQMEAFDNMLADLHTKHGNFDDDWVTLQIMKGASPEQAAKAYVDFENSIRNSQTARPAPPIIGGQGGVPSDQVDTAKVRGADRRDLVAQILEARKQG